MKKQLNKLAKTTALVIALLQCFNGICQTANDSTSTTANQEENWEMITIPEIPPKFPGGEKKLRKFIDKNLQYPEDAKEQKLEGKVCVSFIVKEDGLIEDVKIVRSVAPALDDEAIRLVNSFPKWEPAKQHGKPVQCWFTIPLEFKLNK